MADLGTTRVFGDLIVTGNFLSKGDFIGDGSNITNINANNITSGTLNSNRLSGNYNINASTATTLQTARTINGTSFNGSANITTANWGTARNITIGNTAKSVNGSANVAWTLTEIGAANANDTVYLTGNQTIDGTKTFSSAIVGSLSGNASTATILQTARTINGTSFNGSANITTANWGTARNITIGNTAKSVNGSANVAWTLTEIGAVNRAGDTMTGALTLRDGANQLRGNTQSVADVNHFLTTDQAMFGYKLYTAGSANLFPTTNNANGVLSFNTHTGEYNHQLGFSSNRKLYHRFRETSTLTSWGEIYTSNNKPSAADVNAVAKSGDTMTGQLILSSGPISSGNVAQIWHNGTVSSGNALVARSLRENSAATWIWEKIQSGNISYSTGVTGSGNNNIILNVSGGNITAAGNITGYSDISIKTNIERISNSLDKVKQLSGYTFDRTDIECPRQTGVIAQEVQKVLPEAVLPQTDGKLTVAYGNMVGLLIEAIKELNEKVERLEKENNKSLIDKFKELKIFK
ncbi:hypothetical protein VmeM32_00159 [Vibrio phage vB_VmeM-32]|nr:hypothetical protein VmeM32_00159 [Vibrio phage vB_VmeM-32]